MILVKLINSHVAPYRSRVALVILLQLLGTAAALILPTLNASIIDDGVVAGDTRLILRLGVIMLVISVAQMACQISANYFSAKTAMALGRDMRGRLFDHSMSLSKRELNQFGAATLLTRTTNDVQQIQMLVFMTLAMMVMAPLMMAGGVFMALREHAPLSPLVLVAVIIMAVFVTVIVMNLSPLFQKNQTRLDALNQVVREQIRGVRVIRAFTRAEHERERFDRANTGLMRLAFVIGTWFSVFVPFSWLIMDMGSVAVMWFGGHQVADGSMEIGQITAFLVYLNLILMSVIMATMMVMMAPRAMVSARRINDVLTTTTSVTEADDPVTTLTGTGHVVFDDVCFQYPGAEKPVLDSINFTLEPGTTTAVIGPTGSGKTTLVNLIPRLFDVSRGAVRIDGVDVRDVALEELWRQIGIVNQKPYLFSGTVRSNLLQGNADATDEDLWEALRVAQASGFVSEMDEGLDSEIAQGGTNVSGGQRQRLAIARALVKRPPIYVFDDSFSALDVATDAALRAELAPYTTQSAVLIVAQRVSTITSADQILVLDQGRIVGRGTHDELLVSCELYREIAESQLQEAM